jgi:hypothetical protein
VGCWEIGEGSISKPTTPLTYLNEGEMKIEDDENNEDTDVEFKHD